jgi:hypothetical protein
MAIRKQSVEMGNRPVVTFCAVSIHKRELVGIYRGLLKKFEGP